MERNYRSEPDVKVGLQMMTVEQANRAYSEAHGLTYIDPGMPQPVAPESKPPFVPWMHCGSVEYAAGFGQFEYFRGLEQRSHIVH